MRIFLLFALTSTIFAQEPIQKKYFKKDGKLCIHLQKHADECSKMRHRECSIIYDENCETCKKIQSRKNTK